VPLSPAPPPPPSPPLPPRVTKEALNLAGERRTQSSGIAYSILDVASAVVGTDILTTVDGWVSKIRGEGGVTPAVERIVQENRRCSAEMLLCAEPKADRLEEALVWVAVRVGGAAALASAVGIGISPVAATVVLAAGAVVAIPAAIVRAYDVPAICVLKVPPLLPVCIFDDAFALLDRWVFPRHLNWPGGLSPDNFERVDTKATRQWNGQTYPVQMLKSTPVDCNAMGFSDGITTALYFLQRETGNAWRQYAPLASLSIVFGTGRVDGYATMWLDKDLYDPTLVGCAKVGLVNVPLSISLIIVATFLVIVGLQVFLVLVRSVCRLLSEVA
jgi:hypothetical protein